MAHPVATEPKPSAPLTLHGLSVEGVDRCVHCGLCLAYCPTFSELGTEMDSPRGRIFLVKSLAEGRIQLTDSTAEHLDLCLGCRACETVCPSGVPYGQLIEAARAEIERQRPGPPLRRLFRWMNFSLLLAHPRMLRLAAAGLRVYQVSGLRTLLRASGLLRLLPASLRHWEPLLPELPSAADRAPLPEVTPARGARRARVGLLTGCIQQVAFGPQNRATARVLARNGAEVVAPRAQACCGALHAHAGEHATALDLARRTIEAFERADVEAVIVNTSGCGAHMKAYGLLLAGDPAWRDRAARFASRVRDVSEFLAEQPLRGPLAPVERTVTYHDPCHVVHGQKIRTQPRALLAQVPGLRVVELKEADWCCGSAGTYNLTQPEMATRLQERKIAHVQATGADAVVTANPGCIIQIAQGLAAKGSPVQVLHIVEILDQAYGGD
ncbi:MAG TPA: heterodisulfide reductase-related iron-sulfur binding cluster [Methylomirabilota bacterium]|jgi:glycolate oxidase iron-sulfur subunit|nr:heterodisulfide reductase-related iron-sulfur binding cluster [Methylomirabilota bacterium]